MSKSPTSAVRRAVLGAVLASGALVASAVQPASASHQTVTAVTGSAFGYWADGISLFGGAQADTGPTPVVTLASDASNSPQSATAPSGLVAYGPAVLFTSDGITLNTSGSLGDTGEATTTSRINNINKSTTQPTLTGGEIFTADRLNGTANATVNGVTGSTTVTNGTLNTHHQASSDCTSLTSPCGRPGEAHTHDATNPDGVVTIPTSPPPNYKVAGHLHLGNDTTDYFVLVFNEQVVNPDGSITVNPVHEYFGYKLDGSGNIVADGGSILQGHLYLGQVVAGVTKVPGTHPADVAVGNITDTPDPVARQATVTYTVPVTNVGTASASGVSLVSTVSGTRGATVASATASDGGTCTLNTTKKVTCNLGSVAAGATETVTIVVNAPRRAGSITLTSVVSSPDDGNAANNTGTETTTVV